MNATAQIQDDKTQFFIGFDDEVSMWISRELDIPIDGECRCVGVVKNGQLVAAAAFHGYKGFACELTLTTKDKSFCNRRVLREFFDFGFNFLNCVRLEARCAKNNADARKFLTKVGFKEEGCLKLGHDGKQDAIAYGMLKDDCKWIK